MIARSFRIIDRVFSFFEEWSLFVVVMVGLISLFVNVVLRYTIHYSLAWSEELIREVIIFTTFIGCSAAIKNRSMIRIDALPQIFPVLKKPLDYFSHVCTLGYSGLIFYLGWQMAALQYSTQQKTIILQVPLVLLYAILPLMGAMMFIRTIMALWEDFTGEKV
ncbi:MAG TPA: TRAP transporter small permease [Proteobacteria bacterium]|mgnify:CR=1 FL=1|nr:TRAP transporter small permease [Pseudomonadota bacterium]